MRLCALPFPLNEMYLKKGFWEIETNGQKRKEKKIEKQLKKQNLFFKFYRQSCFTHTSVTLGTHSQGPDFLLCPLVSAISQNYVLVQPLSL